MVNPPLVSIVTPSYNSADFIEAAITSVLAQDYPYLEHVIIDGGSTDQTLAIFKRYNHQLNWISEPDQGQADALNKGFRRARGQIIGWLNADDAYQPQAISQAVRYLQQNPAVDLVYGSFNFIDETGQIISTHQPANFSPEKLLYGNIIPNTSMFFRRKIIDEIGGVNPQLHYVLDWEFVLRIALRYQVGRVPAVWGNFRIIAGTKSVERSDRFWPEFIPVLQAITDIADGSLKGHQSTALFWAYLLGAVEFARTNRPNEVKSYLEQTWRQQSVTQAGAADLVFTIAETAMRPWHWAFREHPEAQQTISRFRDCLGASPAEQALRAYLGLYQGLTAFKSQHWNKAWTLIAESWPNLPKRELLRFSTFKWILYLLAGSAGIAKLRFLKGRLAAMKTSKKAA